MNTYNKATRMFDAYRLLTGASATCKAYEEFKQFIKDIKNFELIEKIANC